MALKTIQIGNMKDIHQYDDGAFTKSIIVEDPISCSGVPVDPDDLVKLNALGDYVIGPATSTDNAIIRFNLATGKLIQDSLLILDDSGNLSKVANDLILTLAALKTLVISPVVYDDWYFEIAPKTTGAGKPTLSNFSGNINQWQMAINDLSELRPVEMAHKWKEATQIELHVHWGTNGLDATDRGVKWEIDYTWANGLDAGGTTVFAAATTLSTETLIPANTPDKTNMYTSVLSFTPAGGKIGAILLMNLKRIASVTNPTPSNDPWIFMVGVHYQIDTIGSRQIRTK